MEKSIADLIQNYIYTTTLPTEAIQRCVVVFNRNFAVSFKHGEKHSTYKIADKIFLYNLVDADLMIEVSVYYISDNHDFIIFKSVGKDFPKYPKYLIEMSLAQKYVQITVEQKHRNALFKEDHFYLGTSNAQYGDSGGALFDQYGNLLGISYGKTNFEFSPRSIPQSKFDFKQLADFSPEPQIIPILVIDFSISDDADQAGPVAKKPCP